MHVLLKQLLSITRPYKVVHVLLKQLLSITRPYKDVHVLLKQLLSITHPWQITKRSVQESNLRAVFALMNVQVIQ